MRVLGLTGSIGMGKSTAANMLRRMKLPVHDADAAVHRLFATGGAAVPAIEAAFPDSVVEGAVDRRRLGSAVFSDPAALRRLEAIVHPLVRAEALAFLRRHRRARRPLVVLDIPLLYETGGDRLCDAVVLVTAPAFLQEQRVLRRPGMTRERLDAVRAQQMPDREKRRRAEFLVLTGRGKGDTFRQLRRIVRRLRPTVATCADEGTDLDA
ncbi:dephospho-CoA kinase [Aquibaculum arenosum]|uniref:Dephospho-CoA kinase n=1 Tax=Aquibaculum arenosum TaxID=3032591 RepID=A0ABT5YKX2_9PROT|nr:dephospho-CoA kinase [Fodinicurvata sp. CAU 1616]MDF2095595.1 dephospho-CoA kinase [Fodinicurvata sp. CAU 1616]